jgi:hypothetical protein
MKSTIDVTNASYALVSAAVRIHLGWNVNDMIINSISVDIRHAIHSQIKSDNHYSHVVIL